MFDKEMQAALIADGEKLAAMTGEDHGPHFIHAALPSSPVSELVDLRECLDRFVEAFPAAADYPLIKRGYTSLTTLSTHNAELEREVKRLREVLKGLVDLNNDYSPFGGELYQDRLDRAWDRAKAALSTSPQGGEHE